MKTHCIFESRLLFDFKSGIVFYQIALERRAMIWSPNSRKYIVESAMHYQWSEFVFVVGFLAYLAIRGVYIEKTKRNEARIRNVDWMERVAMFLVFVGNLLLPIVYLLTPWLAFADYRLPTVAGLFGSLLIAIAVWLFWRSHADLGLNWSVTLEIREGHRLVERGVYRLMRHPMYAAILLFGVAQGLLLHNWFAGWTALATFILLIIIRTPREEKMLRDAFPEEYQKYAQRTWRLIPKIF